MPTGIFIHLMGMDEARIPEFLGLADTFMRVQDAAGKAQNVADIYAVLEDYFAEKKQLPPTDDIASALLGARDADGKPFPHEEIINCAFLLFGATGHGHQHHDLHLALSRHRAGSAPPYACQPRRARPVITGLG